MKVKRFSFRSFVVTASIIVCAACSTVRAAVESDGIRACLPAARHDLSLRRHAGIPSVAVSPTNGRLWAAFYGGEAPGEDSTSYVPLLTSADGGKTWKTVLVAELVDADGDVVSGFSAKDCTEIRGRDARMAELVFKGGSLVRFGAKNVRIRFLLNCATLCSFWISPSEKSEPCGYVAAGGPAQPGLSDGAVSGR